MGISFYSMILSVDRANCYRCRGRQITRLSATPIFSLSSPCSRVYYCVELGLEMSFHLRCKWTTNDCPIVFERISQSSDSRTSRTVSCTKRFYMSQVWVSPWFPTPQSDDTSSTASSSSARGGMSPGNIIMSRTVSFPSSIPSRWSLFLLRWAPAGYNSTTQAMTQRESSRPHRTHTITGWTRLLRLPKCANASERLPPRFTKTRVPFRNTTIQHTVQIMTRGQLVRLRLSNRLVCKIC